MSIKRLEHKIRDLIDKLTNKPGGAPENKKGCNHDWEIVDHLGIYNIKRNSYKTESFVGREELAKAAVKELCGRLCYSYYYEMTNRVCLTCGKCESGEEEIFRWFDKKYKEDIEKARRKELAKNMWEEGCHE